MGQVTVQHMISVVGWGRRGSVALQAVVKDGWLWRAVSSGSTDGGLYWGYDFSVPRFSKTASTKWNWSTEPHPFDSGKMTSTLQTAAIQLSPPHRHSRRFCCCFCCRCRRRCYCRCCCFCGSVAKILTSSLNVMSFDDILPSKRTIFVVQKWYDKQTDERTDMTFQRDV